MRHGGGRVLALALAGVAVLVRRRTSPEYEYQRYLVRRSDENTEQVPRTPPEGGRYGEALAAANTKYRVRGMIHGNKARVRAQTE